MNAPQFFIDNIVIVTEMKVLTGEKKEETSYTVPYT
jgi:hypothetical protein